MNPINLIEICAMIIALCAPLLLALREYIIARTPDDEPAAPKPRNRRGWTIMKWRDNAPFAGRALRYISSRALAIPHIGRAGASVRYSMADGEHEDAVVSVAKEARALLTPEGAWLREGFVEDADGNKLRFHYERGAARFCLTSALDLAIRNVFGGGGRAPVGFHQRLYEAVYDAIGFGPLNLPGRMLTGVAVNIRWCIGRRIRGAKSGIFSPCLTALLKTKTRRR